MTLPDEDRLLFTDPAERDIEAPEADAADQALPADPLHVPAVPRETSYEVSEYDALEQNLVVDVNDDY